MPERRCCKLRNDKLTKEPRPLVESSRQYGMIAIGGVVGALLRESIEVVMPPLLGSQFPIATLLINLSGSLFLGWFYTMTIWKWHVPVWVRSGIGTGLVGSFTTFSTFMVETNGLIGKGLTLSAVLYVLASVIGGLLCAYAGVRLAGERREPATRPSTEE